MFRPNKTYSPILLAVEIPFVALDDAKKLFVNTVLIVPSIFWRIKAVAKEAYSISDVLGDRYVTSGWTGSWRLSRG